MKKNLEIQSTGESIRRCWGKFSHNHGFDSSKVDFDLELQSNIPEVFSFKTSNLIYPYLDSFLNQMMSCTTTVFC